MKTDLKKLTAYEILEDRPIPDLNSQGTILRHKKTGARITLLQNDDVNKVFYIGFRTPPTDSTGVAHIIEHSVLCGSDKYPVKDPFVELAKGSLNTFLNAMTYPDKTVYPVASCNDKDFANLMDVYLDAVFHPNIYKEEKIFRQEGWHYECEAPDQPITINGVVYNEMKGAYSSADDLLNREIYHRLYPDTAYGVDSGGDPAEIPQLTYEDFIAFHQKYYHPSNSFIYLYGKMDAAERLDYIDRAYLSHYDRLKVDSTLKRQEAFAAPLSFETYYPVLSQEESEKGYYCSYNISFGGEVDKELYIAMQVLDYVLCGAPGTPVRVALFDKGIGEDSYSVCENGIYQPFFSLIAKNCKKEDREIFTQTIEETLARLAREGLDKKALQAAIAYYEFRYKEADYGTYPKGLIYGLQALDSWLYDDMAPFMHIEANDTFTRLKEKAEGNYFEELIRTQILENNHKVVISMTPKIGLEKEKNDALSEKLAAYKASLTSEQISEIISQTTALKQYQEEKDLPENISKIPMLRREDLDRKAEPFLNEELAFADTTLLYHDVFTNGVSYIRMAFDISDFAPEDIPYLSLLKSMLRMVGTAHYTYGDLFSEINIQTGGIQFTLTPYQQLSDPEKVKYLFEVRVRNLYTKTKEALALLEEILFSSVLEDDKRMKEILGEIRARMQTQMSEAGHSLAMQRAASHFSKASYLVELSDGIFFYRFLTELLEHFEERKADCQQKMKALLSEILHRSRVFYDYTGTKEGLELFREELADFHKKLAEANNISEPTEIVLEKKNEAYCTSAGIQYVCLAGKMDFDAYSYTGAFRVLRLIMAYEYLWLKIRLEGGAYGCMSGFSRTGNAYFVSYRDPNLEKTVAVYKDVPQYLEDYDGDDDAMTKYVIGAISELDTPLSPNAKGSRSFSAYVSGLTYEDVQRERDEVLSCGAAQIRALAGPIDSMLKQHILCTVGNEEKINENNSIFDLVEPLF